MTRKILLTLLSSLLISANSALWAADPTLSVSAAISLKPALDKAKPDLEKAVGLPISFNYGASGTLAGQIRQGAPVDLFLSADRATAEKLAADKTADPASLQIFATNALVLITPADNPAKVTSFADLSNPAVKKIAIGEPKVVPAGQYAKETLTALHLWDPLEKAGKFVTAENVAQALAYTQRGETDAGLVYSTDALASGKVKIIATAPADSHTPVEYASILITASTHPDAAKKLQAALLADPAQKAFKDAGFTPPTTATQPAH